MTEGEFVTMTTLRMVLDERDGRINEIRDSLVREMKTIGEKIDAGFERTNGSIGDRAVEIADLRANGCARRLEHEAAMDAIRAVGVQPVREVAPLRQMNWKSPAGVATIVGGTGVGVTGLITCGEKLWTVVVAVVHVFAPHLGK